MYTLYKVSIARLTYSHRDGKKIIFGSFLFRDDCYTLLTRLVNVSSSMSRSGGDSPSPSVSASPWPTTSDAGFLLAKDRDQVSLCSRRRNTLFRSRVCFDDFIQGGV